MPSRPTAPDRMRRVLAVVPWIVANPGRKVADVAARFGLTEQELLDDLNVVFMVGLPPYSPDALVDVVIDDEGRVSIDLADFFSRPLRLTPAQGLALMASSDGLLSIPGTDPEGALARAFAKLGAAMGVGSDATLDIHLGDVEPAVLDQLRAAAGQGREAAIVYYSFGRDETTSRTIAPWYVFAEAGSWYVHAWCHLAEGERVFRVDRIESLQLLDGTSEHPPPESESRASIFSPGPGDPRVTIRLAPAASWVADTYPVDVLDEADGSLTVEMVVSALPWLERLLLRLGPDAEIVAATGIDDAGRLGARAAGRILARYHRPSASR